jgi:hypothetical protein
VILVVVTALAGAIAIAVLLTPWPRLPAIFAAMPAFGGLLVIALLRHAEGGGANHLDPGPLQDRADQLSDVVLVVDHERSRHAAFISAEARGGAGRCACAS